MKARLGRIFAVYIVTLISNMSFSKESVHTCNLHVKKLSVDFEKVVLCAGLLVPTAHNHSFRTKELHILIP